MRSLAYWYMKKPMWSERVYFTTCLFNYISFASSVTTSSCRNRLLLMSADVPTSVQYLTSRWRSMLVTVFPYPELPSSFIVSAMIALSGSASPHVEPWKPTRQSVGIMASVRTLQLGTRDPQQVHA